MPRKALNTSYDFIATGVGTGLSGAPVESNAAKVEANFVELDKTTVVVEATPNTTTFGRFAPPAAKTIASIELKRHTAIATGTCTVAVQDADGNTLLSTATIDATALTASYVAQTLTPTTANLDIAAGEPCKVIFVSDSGSTTGGPVSCRITWTAT